MQNRNPEYKLHIYISRLGNKLDIEKSQLKNYPNYEVLFPELLGKQYIDTYEEILALLYKIKAMPALKKDIKIIFNNNPGSRNVLSKNYMPSNPVEHAIILIEKRRAEEKLAKDKQLAEKLLMFRQATLQLQVKIGNEPIIEVLNNLHATLTEEILEKDTYYPSKAKDQPEPTNFNIPTLKSPKLYQTFYPDIIEHFTKLTQKLANKPRLVTQKEIEKSSNELQKKLYSQPISKSLNSAINAVYGAVIGFIIGASAGGVATLWCGGLGAIPGAFIGAAIGFGAGGLVGSSIGFFNARKNQKAFEVKEDNNRASNNNEFSKTARELATNTMQGLVDNFDPNKMLSMKEKLTELKKELLEQNTLEELEIVNSRNKGFLFLCKTYLPTEFNSLKSELDKKSKNLINDETMENSQSLLEKVKKLTDVSQETSLEFKLKSMSADDDDENTVESLLKQKHVDLVKDSDGYNALHYAIKNRNLESIELILDRFPNAINDEIKRPLYFFLSEENKSLPSTPLDIAIELKDKAIIDAITERGGRAKNRDIENQSSLRISTGLI